jgi:osmotically-inducible protein OsmY
MHKPNNLLEADVADQLYWDPQLDNTRVVVSAKDGNITLTGAVPTYFELEQATEDAYMVGGVMDVDNELLVGPLGDAVTDAELAVAATAALDADKFVPKGAVNALVVDGWATLSGDVRHHFQRRAAEHAVGKVDGVLGISNRIAITTDPIPSDVAFRINKAFERNAIIDDSTIEVTNVGPTVYLDGTATSWAAKREAEDTAWDAPGVVEVIDRLKVVA